MRRILCVSLLAAASALAAGCAPSTGERLDRLEAQTQITQIFDLRIANLEDRMTLIEQDMGRTKAGTPAGAAPAGPRKVEPRPVPAKPVAAEPAASPANPRVVPGATPAAGPDAHAAGQPPLAASSTPAAAPTAATPVPAVAGSSAGDTGATHTSEPVEAALADLGATGRAAPSSTPSNAPATPPTGAASPTTAAAIPNTVPGGTPAAGQSPFGSDYYAGARVVTPEPQASSPTAPAAAKPAVTPTEKPQAAVKPAASGSKAAYDAALALFESRKYAESKTGFEAFLAANPGHSLTPNALYWIGECLYSQGDYTGSILKFKDVAGNYPTHHKAAASLLKAGYAYAQLGDMDNAKFYWQMLRHDFPQSSEARLAAKRMESGR